MTISRRSGRLELFGTDTGGALFNTAEASAGGTVLPWQQLDELAEGRFTLAGLAEVQRLLPACEIVVVGRGTFPDL